MPTTSRFVDVPIVVRRSEGRLRTFRNVCAHRHSLVVRPGRGRAATLRCQYHGWEYAGDGNVCRIPDGPSFRGFRSDGLRLVMDVPDKRAVPLEEQRFFYWDWASEEAEAFNEQLRRLTE